MLNKSDTKVESVTSVPVEKKRGRPPGSIREAYFCMAAIVAGELVHEMIQVTRGENITEDEMRTEARKIFLKKHDTDVESEIGPLFEAKLTQASVNKRQSIRLTEADLNYTGRKIQAEYNGWQVTGRYIQDEAGNENNEVVRLFYVKEVEKGEKPRAKPQPTFKAISDLKNIQELAPASV